MKPDENKIKNSGIKNTKSKINIFTQNKHILKKASAKFSIISP
jgi:hypothetical protein